MPAPTDPPKAAWLGLAIGIAAAGLVLCGCAPAAPALVPAGAWYAIRAGIPSQVASPETEAADYLPWTAQARIAGLVTSGSSLVLAVNGWGLVTAGEPDALPIEFHAYEDRGLFAGRTINGLYADGNSVVVHLYRNTLFGPQSSSSGPAAVVTLAGGQLSAASLPLSRTGWETVDVVPQPDRTWSVAWKRTVGSRVEFRYARYTPGSGSERFMTEGAFLASYDFHGLDRGPRALAAFDPAARTGPGVVVHYDVRTADFTRIDYFRSGPEDRLLAGDAELVTVPVVQAQGAYYALLPGGIVEVSDANATVSTSIALPALPKGFAYTDLWSNGRVLVAAWEQQRFPDTGAAGIYVRTIAPFVDDRVAPPLRG